MRSSAARTGRASPRSRPAVDAVALTKIKERAELCRQLAERGEIDARTADEVIAETMERAVRLKELLTATWRCVPAGAAVKPPPERR